MPQAFYYIGVPRGAPTNQGFVGKRSKRGTLVRAEYTKPEQRWSVLRRGGVAQLGEHLPCKQGVMSSNLTISTTVRDDGEYFENRISKDLKFSEKYQSQDIEKYLIVKNQKQETTNR